MLSLKKTSPIVRYAYWFSDEYRKSGPPDAVSLCELFWRCVPPTGTLAGFTAFIIVTIYGIRDAILHPRPPRPTAPFPWWGGPLIGVGTALIVLVWWIGTYPDGWLGAIFYAIKGRMCPRIALEGVTEIQRQQQAERARQEARLLLLTVVRDRLAPNYASAVIDDDGDLSLAPQADDALDVAGQTYLLHEIVSNEFPGHPWRVWGDYEVGGGMGLYVELEEGGVA